MIKLFKEVNKELVYLTEQEDIFDKIEENMWIHMTNPSKEDVISICEKTKLNKQMLLGALDEEETAHLDIDDDDTLILLDIPVYENDTYETVPFAIMYNKKYYVTMCTKDGKLIESFLSRFKKVEPHKHVRLTLQIMYRIASSFISSLKQLDSKRNTLEQQLHSSMKNEQLLDLMTLNKSFVYFSTSLNSNKVVLSKVKRLNEYKKYEEDFDLMEDVEVENNQAIEMCSIYRDILNGVTDTFASLISNNLNVVMKILAIITLVISIPTLIASIYGMNFDVIPLKNNKLGFYIIIAVSIIFALLGAFLLFYFTSRGSKRKKK